jgi:fructokinase
LEVPEVWDTAGSGDWLTAGLLSRLAVRGRKGLRTASNGAIEQALTFGQALASWNCAFEGARGGMYEQPHAPISPVVLSILEEHGVMSRQRKTRPKVMRRSAEEVCDRCQHRGVEQAVVAPRSSHA